MDRKTGNILVTIVIPVIVLLYNLTICNIIIYTNKRIFRKSIGTASGYTVR